MTYEEIESQPFNPDPNKWYGVKEYPLLMINFSLNPNGFNLSHGFGIGSDGKWHIIVACPDSYRLVEIPHEEAERRLIQFADKVMGIRKGAVVENRLEAKHVVGELYLDSDQIALYDEDWCIMGEGDWVTVIEESRPEPKSTLELNTFYKTKADYIFIYVDEVSSGKGFTAGGRYLDRIYVNKNGTELTKADPKEVEELFKKEARRRGLMSGAKVEHVKFQYTDTLVGDPYLLDSNRLVCQYRARVGLVILWSPVEGWIREALPEPTIKDSLNVDPEFKVGDRLLVIGGSNAGCVVKVHDVHEKEGYLNAVHPNGEIYSFMFHRLKHIKVGDRVIFNDRGVKEIVVITGINDKYVAVRRKDGSGCFVSKDSLQHLKPKREIKLALKAKEPISQELIEKYNESLKK